MGGVEEATSLIGCALASGVDAESREPLERIQNDLFHLGADLCVPVRDKKHRPGPRIEKRHAVQLEKLIDFFSDRMPPLANFILPGGCPSAAFLHAARAVTRRAERVIVALGRKERLGPAVLPYINRLSDALFVLARWENRSRNTPEPYWQSRK